MNAAVTIDLLRHGETGQDGFRGSLDDALTPHGWEQMRAAVQRAGPRGAIISSPMVRCAVFAAGIAQDNAIPLHIDERLRELHFGQWEGLTASELMHTQPEALTQFWSDPYAHSPPDAESLEAFESRVLSAWSDIARHHAGCRVLIVTHGGVIRMILRHTRGLPRASLLQLDVPHASLHRVGAPDSLAETQDSLAETQDEGKSPK